MDPIHQFEIKKLFTIAHFGGTEIAFTNSALYMLIALGVILLLMIGATGARALVPAGCRASPRCPTSSWRPPCGAAPARRA